MYFVSDKAKLTIVVYQQLLRQKIASATVTMLTSAASIIG